VDAAPAVGTGTSFANGGQLSYSYVEPFASPSTFLSLPRYLFGARSPVRFRLRADTRQWLWGARFLWACQRKRALAGTNALLALAQESRATLESWMTEGELAFNFARNGKLVLCPDARVLASQAAQVAAQAHSGVRQELLSRDECVAREPALRHYAARFAGGVWTPTECVGDSYLYCQALERAATARGARFIYGAEVSRIVHRQRLARAAVTGAGEVEADAFVLCAGVGGRELAASLGERLPIYPIKGYSVTLQMRPDIPPPTVSVTDLSRKMVLAPLGGKLRVAAMAEVVGYGRDVPSERVDQMLDAVEAIYPGLCLREDTAPWAGLRPATPDSVPVVRRSRVSNAILNLGHGGLGFTLAAGSAVRVARMLGQTERSCA
jgi:D-amino-acid dehydrogenase